MGNDIETSAIYYQKFETLEIKTHSFSQNNMTKIFTTPKLSIDFPTTHLNSTMQINYTNFKFKFSIIQKIFLYFLIYFLLYFKY